MHVFLGLMAMVFVASIMIWVILFINETINGWGLATGSIFSFSLGILMILFMLRLPVVIDPPQSDFARVMSYRSSCIANRGSTVDTCAKLYPFPLEILEETNPVR